MTDDSAGQAAPGYQGAAEPAADLKALDKLVGTWELSGDVGGTVTYEWMKGGFFLIQRVNMVQEDGQETTGIEIIGHERGMGPSRVPTSRVGSTATAATPWTMSMSSRATPSRSGSENGAHRRTTRGR
jgi:hypothetical protein